MRPIPGDYAPYYSGYITQTEEEDAIEALKRSQEELDDIFNLLEGKDLEFRYAPDKWTIKEVLIHVMDSEVIFTCRALQFARGEKKSLPGFDQDDYVNEAPTSRMTFQQIRRNLELIRELTIGIFETLDDTTLSRRGVANDNTMTVNAIGFIIAGHQRHHFEVLKTRYGI